MNKLVVLILTMVSLIGCTKYDFMEHRWYANVYGKDGTLANFRGIM